ncbi:MAG: hypothetical protein KAS32_28470, partial [Candidatus Peribacteraceae bacterium]|nr:hypothetical protein [Candidatus Peribacteraceae bacterium]
NTDIDIAINTPAESFINEIINAKSVEKNKYINWIKNCDDLYDTYTSTMISNNEFINTYDLIHYISEYATASDIIVPDSSGSAAEITLQSIRIKEGQRLILNPGLGSMGYGLPAAIGAAIASGKRTICIIGDGSLQHNIQELETMHRLNLPIKLFVLNNNGYASIRNTHNTHFNGNLVCCDPSSGLTLPSTIEIADAYDIPMCRISDVNSLKSFTKDMLKYPGQIIGEVMVDPDLKTLPRVSSKLNPDGEMVSAAFEDLYPFLPRNEFNAVMET